MASLPASEQQTERVAVEVIPGRPRTPRLVAATLPPPPIIEPPAQVEADPREAALQRRAQILAQIGGAQRAVAAVLAVRLHLLLTLIGAFVLAMGAMQYQSTAGLLVLIAWCCLAILPLVWLEWSGRPGRT
jgi:hypothetical protein